MFIPEGWGPGSLRQPHLLAGAPVQGCGWNPHAHGLCGSAGHGSPVQPPLWPVQSVRVAPAESKPLRSPLKG